MMNNIIKSVERNNDIKRVFGDSSRYYLDDLMDSIQEQLQVLDPCSEEYNVYFEKLMLLDERKATYDKGVREDEERKNEQKRKMREIELKEKQIQSDYDLAKKKVEAKIAEKEAEIALEQEKLQAYQEMEVARLYVERERVQLEHERYVSNYRSKSSFGLLGIVAIGAVALGACCGAYSAIAGNSGGYIEDCGCDYE